MKIALAQLNYRIGNFDYNTAHIIKHIQLAKSKGADIAVFAELAICGYPPEDFLEYERFVVRCQQAAEKIASHCKNVACIVGLPVKNKLAGGNSLHNAAYFIANGEIKKIVKKTRLANYDVFNESRYFEPGVDLECIEFKNKKIALTICHDLQNIDGNPSRIENPMDALIKQQPDLMINIAASPFNYKHSEQRIKILSDNAKKYRAPLFYLNQIGGQTELIFDGGSLVFDKQGRLKAEMNYFEEDFQLFDLTEIVHKTNRYQKKTNDEDIKKIHDALILGIKDYFQKSGFKQAVLGLSGGIDSAVVCALACRALGAENVMAVLMPSKYSSDHSVKDALNLAQNTGCKRQIIEIKETVAAFERTLAAPFAGLAPDITEENIQARCRALLAMAISNKLGYILLNTSNKSECAVGYGTLYGDMCGALAVIGDVYKTQIFELARFINKNREIIPENTIVKAPSAELRLNQKDADSLPDYDALDKVLFQHIEMQKDSETIIAEGFDATLVKRILKMVNLAEFKRYQAPPVLRISPKAFGKGRKMPVVGNNMD